MAEQPIIIVKKKVSGGHAHHGGSWKVAYADFMTAMMAFFMVMWLVGLSQDTRNQIQGYFNDPLGFAKDEPKTKTLVSIPGIPTTAKASKSNSHGHDAFASEQKELEKVQKAVRDALNSDAQISNLLKGVKIELTPQGLLIELQEIKGAVFFDTGSSVIRSDAMKLVQRIAPILGKTGKPLEVQGYTDARPYPGDKNGNFRLSTDRAQSLQDSLANDGVNESQLTRVSGFGATQLLDPQHPFDYSNRRVTILLPRQYKEGDTTEKPGDELKSAVDDGTHPQAISIGPETPEIHASKPLGN